ncbi:puratrophin-1 [Pogoniulus pusillus]|uniref:puratrophin-1 n=1 Tax=Pogoniulus pusillus TaxID=488313 RepID=UPI0030B95C1B
MSVCSSEGKKQIDFLPPDAFPLLPPGGSGEGSADSFLPLGQQDSESLDGCIQSTLSALYPPFEATAATVLCQVFDVVEKTYRGDGLRYLIDFLIPAKHILQCIQQDACVQYCGLLFRHQGWPLCVHEKVVVQLASIDWRILQPGDFYLQVVPYLKKSPRIVLKCLAKDKHNVEEVVIPEVSYTSIFTLEWLRAFNGERMGIALENCLLTTDEKIFRVPWDRVIHPEFINKPKGVANDVISPQVPEEASFLCLPMDHAECGSAELGSGGLLEERSSEGSLTATSQFSEALLNGGSPSCVPQEDLKSDLEGEYVELTEISLPRFGPQRGSLTQSLPLSYLTQPRARVDASPGKHRFTVTQDRTCPKNLTHSALMQKELCQVDTLRTSSQQVLQNVVPLESSKMMAHGELAPEGQLVPGAAEDVGSSLLVGRSPACRAGGPPAEQESCSEPSTDWQYALCSCGDGCAGGALSCKAPMSGAPGSVGGESDGPGASLADETAEQGSETILAAAAAEEVMLKGCGEPLPKGQDEDAQRDISPGSVLGPSGAQSMLEEGSDIPCQSVSDDVPPVQASVPLTSPESSAGGVEKRSSPSGNTVAVAAASACCSQREANLSSPLNPPEQNQGEVAEVVLGRRDSAKEVKETKAMLSVNERQAGHSPPCVKAPADGLVPEGEGQEISACQHKPAEEALLGPSAPSAEGDQAAEQFSSSDSLGPDALAEGSSPSGGQKCGEGCEEPQRQVEKQGCTCKENPVLSPAAVQELQGGEESQGSFSYWERSKPVALKTLESIEEELEVGSLSSGPAERHMEPIALHPHQEAASGASAPKGMVSEGAEALEGATGAEVLKAVSKGSAPEETSPAATPPTSPVPSFAWGGRCGPAVAKDINPEVLRSGVACLPGTRDKSGRAVAIITTRSTAWLNPHCNTTQLVRLLLYLHSIPRAECQALGLTVLVDARRCSPVPALFKAFSILQDLDPQCIHGVLVLVERDVTFRMEKTPAGQFELLTSMKSLHKHIDSSQLPLELDGTFPYCHRDWLSFRVKLEHLLQGCQGACAFLQGAIQKVEAGKLPARAEEAAVLLSSYRQLMKNVLEDSRLVRLQLEGGALLARLRKEESCVTLTQDYRDALDAASLLYNRVDEGVHRLVMLSNRRLQELELLMDFEKVEECLKEVSSWIENVGRRRLRETCHLDDSLEVLLQTQKHFREFDLVASEYCRRGQEALKKMDRWEDFSSVDVDSYRSKLQAPRDQLEEFCTQLDEHRHRICETVRLYEFFDKAYEWALEGMRHLAGVSMEECSSAQHCAAALRCLESYKGQHPDISAARFQEMKELACELKSDRGLKQWKFAWSKCQETKLVFEKKLEAALRTRRSLPAERRAAPGEQPGAAAQPSGPAQRRHSEGASPGSSWDRTSSAGASSPCCSPGWAKERAASSSLSCPGEESSCQAALGSDPHSGRVPFASEASKSPKLPEEKPSLENILESLEMKPSCVSPPAPGKLPARRMLRKAQSFDLPCGESLWSGCQRALSEPARYGNTGVFIRGLEVSSTELLDRTFALRQPAAHSWAADCLLEGQRGCSAAAAEAKSWGSKLRHIIDEMVSTEREYVRSLCYIIDSYFPELERPDLPQDLRGKRSVIFGNLEKLYDFHSQFFLRELESCCNHPLRVSHCFLRHKDQFGLYALYSKNKPKSDALLASHGNSFFKFKQVQLGDKMDLASYLLKPIQRMSKYALLLKDLIKECSEAQEQELSYLRAAEEMVKFQLRHGNDLLAMDAIRDCDVNLKEQGQLVRQDEFTIWLGRRKCQRHVFLFEDLILFSKPKRIEGGFDVYIYKRSIKTADVGLTESCGDSGLRFEIWFRRRKSSDTYVLQASSADTKQAWTSDIARILWQQAARNKEIRMQEMVSMGVGNKPFLDIKPSEAAINDRAIDYIMKGRGARTRASIAVSLFDHSNPYKRTQAQLSAGSSPAAYSPSSSSSSSSSLLGPLNLHMYLDQALLPGVLAPARPFDLGACIEEDELEHETSSQPSLTTESSESSHCLSGSGSSGSDSGCVSSIPQESFCEDLSSPTLHPAGLPAPLWRGGEAQVRRPAAASTSLQCESHFKPTPPTPPHEDPKASDQQEGRSFTTRRKSFTHKQALAEGLWLLRLGFGGGWGEPQGRLLLATCNSFGCWMGP